MRKFISTSLFVLALAVPTFAAETATHSCSKADQAHCTKAEAANCKKDKACAKAHCTDTEACKKDAAAKHKAS